LQRRSPDIHITYTCIVALNTAWYNDLHFHYGYHIYGAAVVANFDPEWGMRMFENVTLLVRNIANPTDDDEVFPSFRMKDWYQGHSWASGIHTPVFLNGMNQESSSESIAAYESVALYGAVMVCASFYFHWHVISLCF
jgi:endo-1,3(4)-beta-glucanase